MEATVLNVTRAAAGRHQSIKLTFSSLGAVMAPETMEKVMRQFTISLVAFCLAGCSNSGPANTSSTQKSSPSAQDALAALRAANSSDTIAIYNAGTPAQCSTGNMEGERVTACQVCVVYVGFDWRSRAILYDGLAAHRVLVPVTFKRGLSLEQPHVSPDKGGVWVLTGRVDVTDEKYGPRTNNRFEPAAALAYLGIEIGESALSSGSPLAPRLFSNGVELHDKEIWKKIESIDISTVNLPENLTPNCPIS